MTFALYSPTDEFIASSDDDGFIALLRYARTRLAPGWRLVRVDDHALMARGGAPFDISWAWRLWS